MGEVHDGKTKGVRTYFVIGNGLGAIVVCQITVGNLDRIKQYIYLKNGAMYSILVLGLVMLLDSFGLHIPERVSPAAAFGMVGFFYWKSRQHLNGIQDKA